MARPRTASRPPGSPLPAVDGALVRLVVTGARWAEEIPPAPAGALVTVTFTAEAEAAHHGPPMALLGYRLAGVAAEPGVAGEALADVLVRQALRDAHPVWWRALAGGADRVFSLALGPCVQHLAPVLRRHLA